jgi:hypothetical protein
MVGDFFSGAGTTGSVAARLGRRFLLSDNQLRALQTTRARLILDQTSTDQEPPDLVPVLVQHESRIKQESPKTTADLGLPDPQIREASVRLEPELVEQVLYWEIDPDYGGEIFHSRLQAARPWRKGSLKNELVLPDDRGQVCLRIVLISGETIQQVLK